MLTIRGVPVVRGDSLDADRAACGHVEGGRQVAVEVAAGRMVCADRAGGHVHVEGRHAQERAAGRDAEAAHEAGVPQLGGPSTGYEVLDVL